MQIAGGGGGKFTSPFDCFLANSVDKGMQSLDHTVFTQLSAQPRISARPVARKVNKRSPPDSLFPPRP